MRTPIFAVALGLALLAIPLASASSSNLRLGVTDLPTSDGSTVPVHVELRVEDVLCSEPRTFTVMLSVAGDGVANGVLDASSLSFPVEARSYFVSPYEARGIVNLTTTGAGNVEVTASFTPEDGACFAPGGIPPSQTTLLVPVGEAPPAESTEQPPAPTPPAEQPPAEQPPAEEPAPEETAAPTPAPTQGAPPTCAPETSCGYIGEYDGGAISGGPNDTPGLGAIATVALLVGAAAWCGRQRGR